MSNNKFEIDKICYEQNYLQVRDLIRIMWRAPVVTMTLTGGLWFGAFSLDDLSNFERAAILTLAALGNIAMIFAVIRVRSSMQMHLNKIRKFSPKHYAYKERGFLGNKTTCATFVFLMACVAIFSGLAALRMACGLR